jgi:hypothetical protein
MVREGGVIRLPGGGHLSFNCSLARGQVYACMAETMMLAMEHRYQDTSLGFDLSLDHVLEMERLGETLGFQAVLEDSERRPRILAARAADEAASGVGAEMLGIHRS